jgi:hypothetical protein
MLRRSGDDMRGAAMIAVLEAMRRPSGWRGGVAIGGRVFGILMGLMLSCVAPGQTPPPEPSSPASVQEPSPPASRSGLRVPPSIRKKASAPVGGHPSPYHGNGQNDKAREFYSAAWGIDRLRVAYTMSGNLIRFSFRVTQPKIAKALGDHESTPYLFAPRVSAMLQVPNMEQVGQLRQLHTDEVDKDYWMVFSNKGNLVRRGDRVNVIIGKFHADGLVVE